MWHHHHPLGIFRSPQPKRPALYRGTIYRGTAFNARLALPFFNFSLFFLFFLCNSEFCSATGVWGPEPEGVSRSKFPFCMCSFFSAVLCRLEIRCRRRRSIKGAVVKRVWCYYCSVSCCCFLLFLALSDFDRVNMASSHLTANFTTLADAFDKDPPNGVGEWTPYQQRWLLFSPFLRRRPASRRRPGALVPFRTVLRIDTMDANPRFWKELTSGWSAGLLGYVGSGRLKPSVKSCIANISSIFPAFLWYIPLIP